ncbi:HNH endonuclease signature motif containing protein [Pseudoxanthobacter sp. M-2]|uniref:HNH endonuclease n=1 Tax=Pseudoxanthobacter sp. M-2 TaxID=3078754 RepID=UPI0038FC3D6E
MWKVEPPAVGDIKAQLDAALIEKDETVVYELSDAERQAVIELYQAYDDLAGEPDAVLVPAALDACKNYLHAAYNQVQKRGRLKDLRGRLLASVIECPLCGFGEATTLDHHLPKDQYRALSIYARNLIPSCHPCNRAKGTLEPVVGAGLIHAYLTELPELTFLEAEVQYAAGRLVVLFTIDDTFLLDDLDERLRFQLRRLDLNRRYFDPVNIFLFNLKTAFSFFRGKPDEGEQIKAFLLASAKAVDDDFKLNHWRAALMRGLAACDAFLADPWSYFDRSIGDMREI